jgi:M6 family metalloprotease-like protein
MLAQWVRAKSIHSTRPRIIAASQEATVRTSTREGASHSPTRPLILALGLIAVAAPAHAQTHERGSYLPLSEAKQASRPAPPLKERVVSFARRLTAPVPHLRRLVPPTQGKFRLGVVLVELADDPRPAFGPADFEAALLSRGTYTRTPTGESAYGSLRDYYLENSSGALDITGVVYDWVKVPAKRADLEPLILTTPSARTALFAQALDGVIAREGRNAFRGCDALTFVVSGRHAKTRGTILWPHSGVLLHGARVWRYYLMHSGEKHFQPIGIHCHEMGHVLGVLDKYGVGSGTGLGQWCLMANGGHGARRRGRKLDAPPIAAAGKFREVAEEQFEELRKQIEAFTARLNKKPKAAPGPKPKATPRPKPKAAPGPKPKTAPGSRPKKSAKPKRPRESKPPHSQARPLHLCSVCKDRLGWSKATALDPRTPQRIYLTPIEDDATQVARVLLDPRGRESLYLEYRSKRRFDADLPASGLLVWREGSPSAIARTFVPVERVELIPAHGVESIDAPLRAPSKILFPSDGKNAFSTRGTRRGSWTVRVDEIVEEDGRLYLRVRLDEGRRL